MNVINILDGKRIIEHISYLIKFDIVFDENLVSLVWIPRKFYLQITNFLHRRHDLINVG
jgi:hypothetical protein